MANSKKILYANNAKSTLAAGISDVATACTVQAGHGTRFSNPAASECMICTLADEAGNREIVQIDTRSTDSMSNITRGMEGTTARTWASGAKIEQRWTAGEAAQMVDQSGRNTYAAAGGTANAITATFDPAYAGLINGMEVRVRAASANTAATTFSPNGLTAKTLYRGNRTPVIAGDIVVGMEMTLLYDSTLDGWIMKTPWIVPVVDALAYTYFGGL